MKAPPPTDEEPHSLCPVCEHVRGKPTCLVVGHGLRTIHYVCTVCFTEWHHATLIGGDWNFRPPVGND